MYYYCIRDKITRRAGFIDWAVLRYLIIVIFYPRDEDGKESVGRKFARDKNTLISRDVGDDDVTIIIK